MAAGNYVLQTFNRGRISPLALARTDLERTRLSSEQQRNFVPRTLGSMMLRPGLGHIGHTANNAPVRVIPFVFNATDTALIEISSGALRAWIDDELVVRVGTTATFTNGTFETDLTGWTALDQTGSTSYWIAGLGLVGTRYARAKRYQSIVMSSGSYGLAVTVDQGRPILRVGSSYQQDDLINETELRTGDYSLEFTTPAGQVWVEFSANTEYTSIVGSVSFDSSGALSVPSTWEESHFDGLRWDQSNDVVFCSAPGVKQKRIERYGSRSWAVVDYESNDGPFDTISLSGKRLTPSALSGDITITADRATFSAGHVGSIFEITSVGQEVSQTFTGPDQFSDSIRVSGVDASRQFDYLISVASASAPVWIMRSIGEEGSWQAVSSLKYSTTISVTNFDDGLDNQIVFYRLQTPSSYGSTVTFAAGELSYAGGGIVGRARIIDVLGATEVDAITLKRFGSTESSELWAEGMWSEHRGFPSAVALHEGRLFWAGKSKLWGSVSDAFESFESDTEGDSGPINITVSGGANDSVQWLVSLARLLLGTPLRELQAKTSSLEEPLTPSNFALRDVSTQGSACVQAIKIDQRLLFVQNGGTRVIEVHVKEGAFDYEAIDKTLLVPEIGEPSIVRSVVQRQPDTRIHYIRSDGTVGMMLSDPAENVLCWIDIDTDGEIEEAAVLPGAIEDKVYYVVKREINGSTVRSIEKWAMESHARGGADNRIADAHVVQNTTAATTTISGLDHLVNESVVVWGATQDLGIYNVSTLGTVTASQPSTTFCAGLWYDGIFKSAKMVDAQQPFGGLTTKKRHHHLGVILSDTNARGLLYGPTTSRLQRLPRVEAMETVSTAKTWSHYDNDPVVFPGSWGTDPRIVLYAEAPHPVTVLGAIVLSETDK